MHVFMGLESLTAGEGKATMTLRVGGDAINPAGVLHGGVIYALADVCAYAALVSAIGDDQDAVTHDLHVSMLRPGLRDAEVTITAEVQKLGRQLAFLRAEATTQGKLMAMATVTKSLIARAGR